jgi:hypothetical protein
MVEFEVLFEVLFEAGRPIMADEIELSEAERAEDAVAYARYLEQLAQEFAEILPPNRDDAVQVLKRAHEILDAEPLPEEPPFHTSFQTPA